MNDQDRQAWEDARRESLATTPPVKARGMGVSATWLGVLAGLALIAVLWLWPAAEKPPGLGYSKTVRLADD